MTCERGVGWRAGIGNGPSKCPRTSQACVRYQRFSPFATAPFDFTYGRRAMLAFVGEMERDEKQGSLWYRHLPQRTPTGFYNIRVISGK